MVSSQAKGSLEMKNFLLFSIFLAAGSSTNVSAATGYLTGETVDGMNKICFYDVLGSTYTLNVKSVELCPLSHDF